jgi:hypothetical protein
MVIYDLSLRYLCLAAGALLGVGLAARDQEGGLASREGRVELIVIRPSRKLESLSPPRRGRASVISPCRIRACFPVLLACATLGAAS